MAGKNIIQVALAGVFHFEKKRQQIKSKNSPNMKNDSNARAKNNVTYLISS